MLLPDVARSPDSSAGITIHHVDSARLLDRTAGCRSHTVYGDSGGEIVVHRGTIDDDVFAGRDSCILCELHCDRTVCADTSTVRMNCPSVCLHIAATDQRGIFHGTVEDNMAIRMNIETAADGALNGF